MNSMCVQAALATVLLFIATVEAQGGVKFWMEDFTMTCPENGSWFKKQEAQAADLQDYTLKYDGKTKGLYHCEYEDQTATKMKYYFYVKGKACSNCFELDGLLFAVVIVVDVVGTAFVMVMIYRCTKKKSSAGLTHASNAPARSGGRGPPVPNPDYEQLNLHTRSQDPYSVVNRMG